jgi:imidazolonepropionase-like amidohydrolase
MMLRLAAGLDGQMRVALQQRLVDFWSVRGWMPEMQSGVIDGIRTVLDHVAKVEQNMLTELDTNTKLTEQVHTLADEVHKHIITTT